MYTTEMIQLFAVVPGKYREPVTEALLREGVMQFIRISELEKGERTPQTTSAPGASVEKILELRKRIEGMLHAAELVPAPPQEANLTHRVWVDVDEENHRLDVMDEDRETIRERQRTIQQEILRLEDIRRQMELYGLSLSEVTPPGSQSLLTMEVGKLSVSNAHKLENSLKNLPAMKIMAGQDEEEAYHVLIYMKRDRDQIARLLAEAGWTTVSLPKEQVSVKKDFLGEVTAKIESLQEEQRKLQKQGNDLVKKEGDRLKEVWVNLRVTELCGKIQLYFQSSTRTVLFAGWLPASKQAVLTKRITEACEANGYLEWHKPGDADLIGDEIPVQFNNPKVLAPFQMLVSNFGIPQYGTIDPTPFVMPIYLCMFGLMFADAGQGAALALLGLWGGNRLKHDESKRGLRNLLWLIAWCGLSSVLFGILFGSYFGFSWFPPVWFNYHGVVLGHGGGNSVVKDIFDILAITIYFGIGVIYTGLLFNWINLMRLRQWLELVFSKGGLLGGWIYGGGIYITYYLLTHQYKTFPGGMELFLLAGLPALLLFIKEPFHHFHSAKVHREEEGGGVFVVLNFLMHWIVELLEIFSGYLSNTLSFMRVAGLGIAHVCLMTSFSAMADMTSGVFSAIILVLGNVLVIGLEGLSTGIQALRLNYYEFFTKFFHGTGKLHTPISLRSEL